MSGEAGMSHQSDTSSCSDDSEDRNTVNPTGIYTMEEFIAEHCVLHNLLERISVKIHAKIKARQAGIGKASQDLWIWHASFNVVGSINDISVLNQSPSFTQVLKGQAPQVQFSISKSQYDMGYYLADEIYPECTVFVKTIPFPRTEKERLFAKHQEEARKDVQRAFGVLQSRFPIVRGPIRFFQRATLGKILQACVILHNMAVQDEKDMSSTYSEPNEASGITAVLPSNIKTGPANCLTNVLQRSAPICIQTTHGQLRRDLIEHIWQQFGPFGDK